MAARGPFPPAAANSAVHWAILVLILAIGVVIQWPHLKNDVLERVHGWRQCQTAMTSRNFIRDGMNPFVARVDYMGDAQMQLELPLYQYLVAVCYKLFGLSEVWGRIIAMLFGIGSGVLMFLIGRLCWNARVGLTTAAVFSWSPLNLFFNRAFLPDSSTICLTLLAVWAFLRYFRDHAGWQLIVGALSITLALAGKPPIVVTVAPPLVVALFAALGRCAWRQGRLAISLGVSMVLFLAWMKFTSHVNNRDKDSNNLGISFTNAGEFNEELKKWYFGDAKQRSDSRTYQRIIRRVPDWVGHWGPHLDLKKENAGFIRAAAEYAGHWGFMALALAGVALSWRTPIQWILPAWFAGSVAYCLIFLNVNFVHNYYQMPIIPMLALAAAVGADRLLEFAAAALRVAATRRALVATVGLCIIGGAQLHAGWLVLRDYDARVETWKPSKGEYWGVNRPLVELGKEINRHLPPREGLTVLAGITSIVDVRDPQLLYYVDRRGYILHAPDTERVSRPPRTAAWFNQNFFTKLDVAISRNARTLVVMLNGLSPQNLAELNQRYRLVHMDARRRFAIYDLTSPARSGQ